MLDEEWLAEHIKATCRSLGRIEFFLYVLCGILLVGCFSLHYDLQGIRTAIQHLRAVEAPTTP
jgi:hypothetical protein